MSSFKKTTNPLRSSTSYNSLYDNPLNELGQNRSSSTVGEALGVHLLQNQLVISDNKENSAPHKPEKSNLCDKEYDWTSKVVNNEFTRVGADVKDSVLRPSSLQLCIQKNEPDSKIGLKIWEHADDTETPNSANIWDYSDSEAAPASSWSTLPNRSVNVFDLEIKISSLIMIIDDSSIFYSIFRSLLYRPLPIDIGRCTCVIVKEASQESRDGGSFYSLYTNVRLPIKLVENQ